MIKILLAAAGVVVVLAAVTAGPSIARYLKIRAM